MHNIRSPTHIEYSTCRHVHTGHMLSFVHMHIHRHEKSLKLRGTKILNLNKSDSKTNCQQEVIGMVIHSNVVMHQYKPSCLICVH